MSTPTLISTGLPELLPQRHRTPGLHVSTIINDLCTRLGYYNPERAMPRVKMQLGSTLEHWIAHQMALEFPGRYFRMWDAEVETWQNGLELSRTIQLADGRWVRVYGTLDLKNLQDGAVEDVKLTWLSSKHDITGDKFRKWWWQVGAYCYMSGSKIGRLHVVHVNGSYGDSADAEARTWERKWDDGELEANWAMLANHGARMVVDKDHPGFIGVKGEEE